MSICWLTQRPGAKHDLSGLAEWGDVKVLFTRGFYPDDVEEFNNQILATLDEKMYEFDPYNDYIVPLGDSCVVAAITAYFRHHPTNFLKFLKYDKKLGGFYQIDIPK